MPRVSHYWVKLAAIVAVFSLIVPVLATGTAAQDERESPARPSPYLPGCRRSAEEFLRQRDRHSRCWFTRD